MPAPLNPPAQPNHFVVAPHHQVVYQAGAPGAPLAQPYRAPYQAPAVWHPQVPHVSPDAKVAQPYMPQYQAQPKAVVLQGQARPKVILGAQAQAAVKPMNATQAVQPAPMLPAMKAAFDKLDTNHDGVITRAEWEAQAKAAAQTPQETQKTAKVDPEAAADAAEAEKCGDIWKAASEGNLRAVRHFQRQGLDLKAKDSSGRCPLLIATERQHTDLVKFLLDCGAGTEAKDNEGGTALHLAASKGYVDLVRLMLDRGANTEAKDESECGTPLHLAASHDFPEVVRVLLDGGADVTAKDSQGQTPLHRAAPYAHAETGRFLLDKGAEINARDCQGETPLHQAALQGHVETVQLLLGRRADLELQDEDFGETPLHFAAACGHREIVELLLEAKANLAAKDREGATAVDLAKKSGRSAVVEFLQQ